MIAGHSWCKGQGPVGCPLRPAPPRSGARCGGLVAADHDLAISLTLDDSHPDLPSAALQAVYRVTRARRSNCRAITDGACCSPLRCSAPSTSTAAPRLEKTSGPRRYGLGTCSPGRVERTAPSSHRSIATLRAMLSSRTARRRRRTPASSTCATTGRAAADDPGRQAGCRDGQPAMPTRTMRRRTTRCHGHQWPGRADDRVEDGELARPRLLPAARPAYGGSYKQSASFCRGSVHVHRHALRAGRGLEHVRIRSASAHAIDSSSPVRWSRVLGARGQAASVNS